jgi:hypothetical protein
VTTAARETGAGRRRHRLTGGAVDEDRSAIVAADADMAARLIADLGEPAAIGKGDLLVRLGASIAWGMPDDSGALTTPSAREASGA